VEHISYGGQLSFVPPTQIPATIGGATIFVLDIENFKKI